MEQRLTIFEDRLTEHYARQDPASHVDLLGYVNGSLDAQNLLEVEVHLQSCSECRRILSSYTAVADIWAIDFSLPQRSRWSKRFLLSRSWLFSSSTGRAVAALSLLLLCVASLKALNTFYPKENLIQHSPSPESPRQSPAGSTLEPKSAPPAPSTLTLEPKSALQSSTGSTRTYKTAPKQLSTPNRSRKVPFRLHVGIVRQGEHFSFRSGGRLKTGDRLGFFYSATKKGHLTILYGDHRGNFVQIVPPHRRTSAQLQGGEEMRLADGALITEGRGCEWIIGFYAKRPLSFAKAIELANTMWRTRRGCQLTNVNRSGLDVAVLEVRR